MFIFRLLNSLLQSRPQSIFGKGPVRTTVTSLEDIGQLVSTGVVKNIVLMAGAGISTSSGIPDFRTPGSGLYDNLQKYNLPYAEAIFDIDYFSMDPRPFFALAKELYPGQFRPNAAHYFGKLLYDKGILTRFYTQNIDGLERLSGISPDFIVEAHGSFSTASCTQCRKAYLADDIKEEIFKDKIPHCVGKNCKGVVKPDIVFFGEMLPDRFYLFREDLPKADLLIVMGSSLVVQPFAGLADQVSSSVPRLLINNELVGTFCCKKNDVAEIVKGISDSKDSSSSESDSKPEVNAEASARFSMHFNSDIVVGVKKLVQSIGWQSELENLMKT